jgi:hypothetical protein
VNTTVTLWSPAVTDVILGAADTVGRATTAAEETEAVPRPTSFLAAMLHVYVLLLVRPPTRTGDVGALSESVTPPSLEVQVAW